MSTWTPIPREWLEAAPDLYCPKCRSGDVAEYEDGTFGCGSCGVRLRYAEPMPGTCPTCGYSLATNGYPVVHAVPGSKLVPCGFVWASRVDLAVTR